MATGVASWSQTAATNATADSNVNWSEGQAPSTVNNSARAQMASVAKWRDDTNGTLTTGGSSTAYTITSNQSFGSLSALDGMRLAIRMHTTSGASPTLAVDGLSALAIVTSTGVAVPTGALLSGNIYHVTLVNSSSEFRLHGWYDPQTAFGTFGSGTVMLFGQTSAPTGWTKSTANNDAALRVVSGTVLTGGSTAFSSVFASRTITQGNLPSYNLVLSSMTWTQSGTATVDAGAASVGLSNGVNQIPVVRSDAGTFGGTRINVTASTIAGTIGGTLASGGSGTAMDFAVKYVDVIIATKD